MWNIKGEEEKDRKHVGQRRWEGYQQKEGYCVYDTIDADMVSTKRESRAETQAQERENKQCSGKSPTPNTDTQGKSSSGEPVLPEAGDRTAAHPPVSGITLNAHGWSLPVKRHRPLDWKVRPTRPFSRIPWPCLSPLERPFSTKTRQPYAASRRHILASRTSTGSKWGYRRCYYKQTAAERKWM